MGAFIAGLLGGASDAVGQHFDQERANKSKLTDQERQQKVNDYNNAITTTQHNLAAAREAGDNDAFAKHQTQLQQLISDRTNLFHPDNGPGAMEHLGRMLWDKVHGTPAAPSFQTENPAVALPNVGQIQAAALPGGEAGPALPAMQGTSVSLPATPGQAVAERSTTPGDLKQRFATDMSYNVPDTPPNQFSQLRQHLIEVGMTPEKADEAVQVAAGVRAKPLANVPSGNWEMVTGTVDGQPQTFQRSKFDGSIRDLSGNAVSTDVLTKFIPTPKASASSIPKVGTFGDFMLAGYGPHPTAQQYQDGRARWNPGMNTSGTHEIQVPQPDGSIKLIQVTTTSSRHAGATTGALPTARQDITPPAAVPGAIQPQEPSVAATPAALKQRVKTSAPAATTGGAPKPGDIIGGRMTAPQVDAQKKLDAAVTLSTLASQAAAHPTAQNQKNLALQIIRGAAGRVNMQEYDILTRRAGIANSIQAWANNTTTGMLPDQIWKGLLSIVRDNEIAARAGQAQSRQSTGASAAAPAASIDDIVNALNQGK